MIAISSLPTGIAAPPTEISISEIWQTVDPDLLESLSEEITSLSARIHAETHRLLTLIAEFDRLEGWRREGFGSCAEWLACNTHLDKVTAREKVRVARALAGLPETSAAMSHGELSFSQVRALTRVADAESEEELLEHARSMSAAALERLCRSWRRLDSEDEAEMERRRHASRYLSVFPDDEGMYLVRGRLDAEVGALLMRAIEAASDAQYRGSVPETTPDQRRADAIGLLAERALEAGFGEEADDSGVAEGAEQGESGASPPSSDSAASIGGRRAERYLVVLHVDDLGTGRPDASHPGGRSHLEDGTRVSAETSRRVACDANVVRVTRGGGTGEGTVERRVRAVPPRMRRALELRDAGCRFPGCGSRFTDAHHIRHWADGGPTRLDNLVLLCKAHHRLLHEGGFRLEANPDHPGSPTFFAPRGVQIPAVPPRFSLGGAPLDRETRVERGDQPRRWDEDMPLALYLRATGAMG